MKNTCRFGMLAILIGGMFITFMQAAPAMAGASFSASVSPKELNLTVTPQGGIRGRKFVSVIAERVKKGSGTFCAKIRWVDVVKGGSYRSPSLASLRLDPRRCFFKRTLRVQPFTDAEIRKACKGAGRTTQRLEAGGTVYAWNYRWALEDAKESLTPKNSAPIRMVAKVQCGTGAAQQGASTPPPPATPSRMCDFSGTWYEHAGGKKYLKWRLTQVQARGNKKRYRVEELTSSGQPLRSVKGTFYQEDNAQLLLFTNSKPASGGLMVYEELRYQLKGSCDQMDEVERRDTMNGMSRSKGVWIERVKGSVKQTGFNPGRPSRPGGQTIPQQKKPQPPGSGFNPGPNLPRW